jgi:MFS transporter, DHA1 family, multidrug resistance protein
MPLISRSPGRAFSFALGSISFVGPLAVHLFLPAIPAVKAALALTDARAQLAFSVSLFGMAFATLVYGSLSDRYGRRPVLLSGLGLFLAGSIIAASATGMTVLVIGRLIQAIGAGCGMTLVRTIARDAYGPERLVKALAYLTMFYTLGPMIAPLVGGLLIDALGWRSVFAFAIVVGAAILLAAFLLIYETHPEPAARHTGTSVFAGYARLFGNPRFAALVFQTGFSTGVFLTLASASSSLMKEFLHRPATEFGVYFVLFPIGYFCGNLLTSRVGARASIETMVLSGSLLSTSAVAVQAAVLLSGHVTPLAIFLPGFFITMAQGLALPYAQSGAMATVPQLAGTAAGVGVFVQHICGAALTQLYGLIADGGPGPMIAVMALSSSLCLVAGVAPLVLRQRSA